MVGQYFQYYWSISRSGLATLLTGFARRPSRRRKSERNQLKRSQETLARAQRISNVGSFERDLVTGKTEFSDQFLRIHGVDRNSPDANLALMRTLVHPDDAERVEQYRRESEHGTAASIDYRIVRPNGQIRVIHRVCEILFDDAGKPVCLFGTLQDITKQKEAELELRRSRERLARAQRIASIGSFDHDLVTNVSEWSDELYRLYGLSPQETRGDMEVALSFVHPDDHVKFTEFSESVDFRIIRRDGIERILHREADITFDDMGRPVRVFGTVQDITERHLVEREIQRSRENLARAQRIAGIGSFEHNVRTGKVEWSEQMYRILGLERTGAFPGPETLLKLIHPEDLQKFVANRSKEVEGETTRAIEYRITCPDGTEKILRHENEVVRDELGRPAHRYGTIQDMTALRFAERRERELERKLMHSLKLESLGTLAGGIAHDLNNTLVPILGLSKLTARRLEAGNPIRKNLETIYEASTRARDLVSRVLAFSRNEAFEAREIELGNTLREALELLHSALPTTIKLESRIENVGTLLVDPTQIHQIITNLVTNAAQAIGDAFGTITVTLDATSASELRLSVGDTGIGIDERTKQRIFEPFFTTKSVGEGTGLGLSIVHGIVTTYGGRIEVSSEIGRGTRFDVYFPVIARANAPARPAA